MKKELTFQTISFLNEYNKKVNVHKMDVGGLKGSKGYQYALVQYESTSLYN